MGRWAPCCCAVAESASAGCHSEGKGEVQAAVQIKGGEGWTGRDKRREQSAVDPKYPSGTLNVQSSALSEDLAADRKFAPDPSCCTALLCGGDVDVDQVGEGYRGTGSCRIVCGT